MQPRSNWPPCLLRSAGSVTSRRQVSSARKRKRRRSSLASARRRRRMLLPLNNRFGARGGSTQPASSSFEGECNEASIPLALDAQNNILASVLSSCSDLLLQLLKRSHRLVTYRDDEIARA